MLLFQFQVVVHSILYPSREEMAMAYMVDIEVLTDVEDNIIIGLVTLLGNGATIQDEGGATEPITPERVPQNEE